MKNYFGYLKLLAFSKPRLGLIELLTLTTNIHILSNISGHKYMYYAHFFKLLLVVQDVNLGCLG